MGRIPDEEIERIKREVSVQTLAEARGVKLKRHGADLIGLCPWHDDREPSLVITPTKNLWHCLGACQTGGSVIDWVMKAEGVGFRHAVEILRADCRPSDGPSPKTGTVPKLPPPVDLAAEDPELARQVIDFYHQTLKESSEALEYLEKRGLRSLEAIEHFRIGFGNRTLGLRLPAKTRKAGREIRGRLEELGFIRKSGHEHFAGSLIVPVFNGSGPDGDVVEAYGRKITAGLRKGTPLHLYLPGPHRGVWNLQALAESKVIILCEALLDALTFWSAGHRHVTSSYGIQGFTKEHLEAFQAYGTERVLIAYDRDDAGDVAAAGLAEKLLALGIECYRIQFPRGTDANEYAVSMRDPGKALADLIRQATWLGQPRSRNGREAEAAPAPVEEVPPASPVPAPPPPEIPVEVKAEEVVMQVGDRRYRVRGLRKNLSYDVLKINLLASREDGFHVDTLDLYSARQRNIYIKQTAEELKISEEVAKQDLGKVLLKLEQLQDEQIRAALEPKETKVELSDADRAAALDLLRDPRLLDRILEDFERCGVVGEETNKLVGYLTTVSRKLEKPLAVMIQSSSAAGKSALMESILALVPEEDRVQYSAMTGQSLFYMGEKDLRHKVLAIAEEEGAERASYALKLLQSEGRLSIASTGKNPQSGRLETQEYQVEGPVAIVYTTTAIELDEELLNRCLVLTVDEGREQTRAIHRFQRESETIEGLMLRRRRAKLLRLHSNAQRLLRPLEVTNPYARNLTFPDSFTRTRRDQLKYLALIRSIALLHQYQRKTLYKRDEDGERVPYIEVTVEDIELANRLAGEVLGRSLDELPPQTRRFLVQLEGMVLKDCQELGMSMANYRFTRRDLREELGWSYSQVRAHVDRLVEFEYVIPHRGCRGQSFVYELLYDGAGQNGHPFLMGLIDGEALRKSEGTTKSLRGSGGSLRGAEGEFAGPKRPHNGGFAGGLRSGVPPSESEVYAENRSNPPKNAYREEEGKVVSKVQKPDRTGGE